MKPSSIPDRNRHRRGSALLLCTLAIAVISVASIAILRSNQRSIAAIDGTRVSRQGRHTADGLLQRAIATIRLDPKITGSIALPKSTHPGQRLELISLSPTATRIEVYLYAKAKAPARQWMVDPTKLAAAVKPPVVTPVKPPVVTPVMVVKPSVR